MRVKGLVNQPGLFGFFHYTERFGFGYFFSKSLSSRVPGGFAEGEAIQGGRFGAAGITQQAAPLPAEAVSDRNILKFVDNVLDTLAGQDKFFRII